MSDPFLAEIRLVSFNFAQRGWALAYGQTLAINSNQALFSLLGTTYGGNGQTTFLLPNMQSRIPIHVGTGQTTPGYNLGQLGGVERITVPTTTVQVGSNASGATTAVGYAPSKVVETMMPYLVLNFVIALQGIYPSRN